MNCITSRTKCKMHSAIFSTERSLAKPKHKINKDIHLVNIIPSPKMHHQQQQHASNGQKSAKLSLLLVVLLADLSFHPVILLLLNLQQQHHRGQPHATASLTLADQVIARFET